jgi:hypothetical protein
MLGHLELKRRTELGISDGWDEEHVLDWWRGAGASLRDELLGAEQCWTIEPVTDGELLEMGEWTRCSAWR